jgi:outer membrane lipoprotein-sorting protein
MRRILLSTLLLVLVVGTGNSQSTTDTKNMMDRVSKKLQSYKTVKVDFSFTLENEEEAINDTQEGSLILAGDKYRLTIMGIVAICDGATLWTVNDELKEASIIDPAENELFNPKSIFSLYEKEFRYEPVSSTSDRAIVDLIPLKTEESYSKIRMEILKAKDQIEEVTYYSTDGNQYIITIKSLSANIPADDKMFIFDSKQYPGVKVFDMR